jgi:hypothetical protein
MENLVDHILAGLALLFASVAAWFARRATRPNRRQQLGELVRDAVAYARAHSSPGIPLERTALDAARRLDLLDGKRDFADEALLMVAIKAEIAQR